MNEIKLDKLISLILRYKSVIIHMELDEKSRSNVNELIEGIKRKGYYIDIEILNDIVKK